MRQHENEADPESKILQCAHCTSKFSTRQFFDFHQKCHEGSYKLSCDVCSKMIPALSLEDHLNSHIISSKGEDPPLKIIYCQNCSFCCTSRKTYLTHLERHKSRTTKGKFTCDICSEELSTQRRLFDHFYEKHGQAVTKIRCDFPNCGKLFPSISYLAAHKWVHSKREVIPCLKCDKKFASSSLLKLHSRTHTGEKPFGCNLCEKRFRWQTGLLSHQRTEHGTVSKLKCEICGKEFVEKRGLNFHIREVHGDGNERFPCKICGDLLKHKQSLKGHMARAHGDERKWTCEQCGKRFKLEHDLKLHMKVHSGVKNWKCEYCGKAFVRKENLTDHLRVHTGERPFVCEICGKDFNQPSALRTHKMYQHPI